MRWFSCIENVYRKNPFRQIALSIHNLNTNLKLFIRYTVDCLIHLINTYTYISKHLIHFLFQTSKFYD